MILSQTTLTADTENKGKLLTRKKKKKSKPAKDKEEVNVPSMEPGLEDEEWGILSDPKVVDEEKNKSNETKTKSKKSTAKGSKKKQKKQKNKNASKGE
jgi:hypothetical protein